MPLCSLIPCRLSAKHGTDREPQHCSWLPPVCLCCLVVSAYGTSTFGRLACWSWMGRSAQHIRARLLRCLLSYSLPACRQSMTLDRGREHCSWLPPRIMCHFRLCPQFLVWDIGALRQFGVALQCSYPWTVGCCSALFSLCLWMEFLSLLGCFPFRFRGLSFVGGAGNGGGSTP